MGGGISLGTGREMFEAYFKLRAGTGAAPKPTSGGAATEVLVLA